MAGDSEDWIGAADAITLLKPVIHATMAAMTIAARANDGVIRSRAARFIRGRHVQDDIEVPPQFWWARGHAALEQNWRTGDFETWIENREHWRVYGVRFLRSQIEDMIPNHVGNAASSAKPRSAFPTTAKVFVVHGHDEAALQAVARYLERLGLEATILREQADAGRTIIEKFEDCAGEVGFAVVLLTPDDVAGTPGTPASGSRARQNVIFELGYFAGKLGRGRTCRLRKGEVEIPSDLYGVIYTDMDAADGWKRNLARELNAAGFDFDPAKVFA
jgi:predicted nucleotide-binding protein